MMKYHGEINYYTPALKTNKATHVHMTEWVNLTQRFKNLITKIMGWRVYDARKAYS